VSKALVITSFNMIAGALSAFSRLAVDFTN
jgi:hypothetical protein